MSTTTGRGGRALPIDASSRTHPRCVPATSRLRAAWTKAHAPVPGVPRWARMAAFAVPLTVLPSSVWRVAVCTFDLPIAPGSVHAADTPSGIPGLPLAVYVVLLSLVSEALAFTAVGLIARWGEVFPQWIPFLRGRTVPIAAALVPAAAGATVLTLLWTWTAVSFALGRRVDGSVATGTRVLELHDWQGWVTTIAYAPLLLWGPLLGAVAVSYRKRRRACNPSDGGASRPERAVVIGAPPCAVSDEHRRYQPVAPHPDEGLAPRRHRR